MPNSFIPIYQTTQIRELEHMAIERFNISGYVMMQRAGKAALECVLRYWPNVRRIAIICGAGNNGGDGYVLARLAHERGIQVNVWQVGDLQKQKTEAKQAYKS